MFNLKGIAIGAGVGAAAGWATKVGATKGAMVGAIVAVAGPLVEGMINKAMYPAAIAPAPAGK